MILWLEKTDYLCVASPGPKVIRKSCSVQLSIKLFLLINVKMPTIVGISTLLSRKSSVRGLSEPEQRL